MAGMISRLAEMKMISRLAAMKMAMKKKLTAERSLVHFQTPERSLVHFQTPERSLVHCQTPERSLVHSERFLARLMKPPTMHHNEGLELIEYLFQKQCQLLNLCEMVWPRQNKFVKLVSAPEIVTLNGNELAEVAEDGALFADVELRNLAMQGICMLSFIVGKAGSDNNLEIIQQLEEMYRMLLGRLDFHKQKLISKLETSRPAPELCSVCCLCTPDVLCRRAGLDTWIKTQPIVDETSLCLDLELLQRLTRIAVVDIDEQYNALSELSGLLKSSMTISLSYASRPLIDISPHQKLLWILYAWELVQGANEKISSFTLDMWFRWHRSLWEVCLILVEAHPRDDDYNALLPHKFFWPLKLAMVDQILNNASPIRDFQFHSFKLRAASRSIWQSSENMMSFKDMFSSSMQSLFHQGLKPVWRQPLHLAFALQHTQCSSHQPHLCRYFTSKRARLIRKARAYVKYVCWRCVKEYDVPYVYKEGKEGYERAQEQGYTTSSEVVVPNVYYAMVKGKKKKIYLKYNSRHELATHYEKEHKIVKGGSWKCCGRCNNIFHKKVEFHICIVSDTKLKEEFRRRKEGRKDDGSEEEELEEKMESESEEELEEKDEE